MHWTRKVITSQLHVCYWNGIVLEYWCTRLSSRGKQTASVFIFHLPSSACLSKLCVSALAVEPREQKLMTGSPSRPYKRWTLHHCLGLSALTAFFWQISKAYCFQTLINTLFLYMFCPVNVLFYWKLQEKSVDLSEYQSWQRLFWRQIRWILECCGLQERWAPNRRWNVCLFPYRWGHPYKWVGI